MTPPPLVSLIIPAYRRDSVGDCLDSLRSLEGDGVPFDVHVVLNDAPERIRELVRAFEHLPLVVHDCAANLGVARSYNLAFSASPARYMLGLQDDAVVEAGLLAALLARVESADDIAGACALVTDRRGEVWDVGWVLWSDGSLSPRWLGRDRDPALFAERRAVAHHGTLGMLLRRDAWQSVGGFDPAYYPVMYGDVDMSIALRRRGWRIVVEPLARASQEVNGSTTAPLRQFLVLRHQAIGVENHGSWLAHLPGRSDDPAAIALEADRVAEEPPGPAPTPATADELALLESRLVWTPEQMLRQERDLLADYGRHLEALRESELEALAAVQSEIGAMRGDYEQAVTVREAAECETREALAEKDRALAERDAVHAELESIALSRTWRAASAVRHAAGRMRNRVRGDERSRT